MADASDREQVDAALALIDDVFATFLIPHDDADPMHAGWTRRASVRADVAQKWRDRRAALAARTPQSVEPQEGPSVGALRRSGGNVDRWNGRRWVPTVIVAGSNVCDACRGDARAVAAALTATEETA